MGKAEHSAPYIVRFSNQKLDTPGCQVCRGNAGLMNDLAVLYKGRKDVQKGETSAAVMWLQCCTCATTSWLLNAHVLCACVQPWSSWCRM
jgi:hypothetical protein